MKKTICPRDRKNFPKTNIALNIIEGDEHLRVKFLLRQLKEEDYPGNARIILEAFNRINIDRIDSIGSVEDYDEEERTYDLPSFQRRSRPKINFRLKIIDPDTYKILGYAENMKEGKYANALLELSTDDESVSNIYRIDFDNEEHPIFYLNSQLKCCTKQLKPIIAEMALKDILIYLLFNREIDNLEDHKWFQFSQALVAVEAEEIENSEASKKLEWVHKVLVKFSKDKRIIGQVIKGFNND